MASRGLARAILKRMVAYLCLGYLVILAVFYFAQGRLIFVGQGSRGGDCQVSAAAGTELVTIAHEAEGDVVALFGAALTPDGAPRSDAAVRPSLIFFYGNGDCLGHCGGRIEGLRRLGLNVLVPDYPGYGASAGQPSEASLQRTADAAYDYLAQRKDVAPRRIVSMGQSLGGAAAIALAARRPVAGLVACSAFTSISDIARQDYPWLAVSLILKHRFDNDTAIARVNCPILLAHGTADRVVPFAMCARLAAAAKGPVTRVTLEHAGHNDVFDGESGLLMRSIGTFVEALPR